MVRGALHRLKNYVTGKRHWTGGTVSPWREIPSDIVRPSYSKTGLVLPPPAAAVVNDEATIGKLRAAGRLARQMLDFAESLAKPGVSTDEIDRIVHERIIAEGASLPRLSLAALARCVRRERLGLRRRVGAYPAPYNYMGFPKSICSSPNDVICHGIPDSSRVPESRSEASRRRADGRACVGASSRTETWSPST